MWIKTNDKLSILSNIYGGIIGNIMYARLRGRHVIFNYFITIYTGGIMG